MSSNPCFKGSNNNGRLIIMRVICWFSAVPCAVFRTGAIFRTSGLIEEESVFKLLKDSSSSILFNSKPVRFSALAVRFSALTCSAMFRLKLNRTKPGRGWDERSHPINSMSAFCSKYCRRLNFRNSITSSSFIGGVCSYLASHASEISRVNEASRVRFGFSVWYACSITSCGRTT